MTDTSTPGAQVTLPSDTDIVITRRFGHSREDLWRAWTEPTLLRQWLLGPDGWTMPVCEVDLRVGGTYRYEWAGPGESFGTGGTFLELDAPRRMVTTEAMDGFPAESRVTIEFQEAPGGCVVVLTQSYPDRATRDAVVATGMADGVEISHQRLESILASA